MKLPGPKPKTEILLRVIAASLLLPPEDPDELAAIGHADIEAFLCDERVLARW
jgi:hypothetical protein